MNREDKLTVELATSRRGLIQASALAGAGLLLPTFSASAQAKGKSEEKIVAEEYWGNKKGVKLWIYRKYIAAGVEKKPILFMVHGSSYSSKTMFDLDVPGQNYSVMNHFVRLGYDVWTMDHEGYGHSDRTTSYSDIASGADDLKVAMDIIARKTGKTQAAYFGQSSGALRAAKFCNVYPQHVASLMLGALVYTGAGSRTLATREKSLPKLLASNVRKVSPEFYSGVFTRDKPGSADPNMGNWVAEAEMKYGDTVPNGTYLDMVTKLPIVDPLQIPCPVLIARGEYDGIASDEDVLDFYEKLPNPDKQIAKMGGLAHTSLLGVNRFRLFHVMQSFLTMPTAIPLGDAPPSADGDPG